MSNAEDLIREAKECLESMQKIKERLNFIKRDAERLTQPDVLPIGTRVRLKENYNTEKHREKRPGWSSFLCFMHPNNPATIMDINVYDLKVTYFLKFDCQEYSITSYTGETKKLKEDCYWLFSRDSFEII